MNERREQTMLAETDKRDDGGFDGAPDQDGGEQPARPTGGMSTADMAAAMERGGDESEATAATVAAAPGGTAAAGALTDETTVTPLFPDTEADSFRSRWTSIQTGFVDEPRAAVEQADQLVAEVIQRLAQVFAEERQGLEGQWGQDDHGDTEALRVALRRYRSFFERLLAA